MSRRVEYVPDGRPLIVAETELVSAWKRHSSVIPLHYVFGTAQHESAFAVNERDTEPSGFQSLGIFQLSLEEARDEGFPNADLLTLEDSCKVFASLCDYRLHTILRVAGLSAPIPDVWAYLALAHNQGLGACIKTIKLHDLDWSGYIQRNPTLTGIAAYGNDCITGGWKYKSDFDQ
jgi:hypothetical protein